MSCLVLPEFLNCGYYDSSKSHNSLQSPKRIAKTYEIELFTENGHSTFIGDKEIRIKKNHIIITRPNELRYSLLHFKTIFIKFSANQKLAEILNSLPVSFYAMRAEKIKSILHEIILLNESVRPDELLISSKFLSFISLIVSDANNNISNEDFDYDIMHRSKRFIEEHFNEKISSKDIADCVNLSESHFRTLFKSTYGISPHHFLVNVRINAAKQMLWHSDITMVKIAESCGFGCQQYFNNVFKKVTNLTPQQYRAQFAEKYNAPPFL